MSKLTINDKGKASAEYAFYNLDIADYLDGNKGDGARRFARGDTQLAIIDYMYELASKNGMPTGGAPSLGDTICHQQAMRVEQFGEKTFPLSSRQIAVIANELEPWTVVADNEQ